MSAANKRKGKNYEHDLLKWFRREGLDAELIPDAGAKDESDIRWANGGLLYVYEAKNAKVNMTDFVRQAREQAANYEAARGLPPGTAHWAAIIKKRNAPISESFVLTSLTEHIRQVGVPF